MGSFIFAFSIKALPGSRIDLFLFSILVSAFLVFSFAVSLDSLGSSYSPSRIPLRLSYYPLMGILAPHVS